ncbi:PRTRC system ThiF family protein [Methylophilus sp. QUAN]|uniref:PRTRC system ThiF family protein n=1 Tax=Methylophilus sp. QUAN TaxID=2781020 RepID=UPI00188E2781|nr:PRTRC system ThiF family protein [Methylophilus sp. QUAN]MBF4991037.1 PRTRC system ThiF family protein [Methylophilus sp. QUAN]
MNNHVIKPALLSKQVQVHVIGAGGTGSHVMQNLAALHHALLGLGHPAGLHVTLIDYDTVSETNVGRQCFFPSDVGHHKAEVLINRANLGWQTNWDAVTEKVTGSSNPGRVDIVIGCVDNRLARKSIVEAYSDVYYLDFGNRKHDGQIVLGMINPTWKSDDENRLPHIGDLFPDAIDPSKEQEDDTPSCSLAEALEKQSLFINKTVATYGINLLAKMFTKGEITSHGVFVNLETERSTPLPIDPEVWARMGFKPKKARKARTKKQ